MDQIQRYNCRTIKLELLSPDEPEKLSIDSNIWMDIKVKLRDLNTEEQGHLKFGMSMYKQMLQHDWCRIPIYQKLSELHVPEDIQASVADDILARLSSAPEIVNANCMVLRMEVSIEVVHYAKPEFGIVKEESLEIEKLRILRMPCSHEGCIVDWVRKSTFCPLCNSAKRTEVECGKMSNGLANNSVMQECNKIIQNLLLQ